MQYCSPPLYVKIMQELDALITLWPLSSWRTSGECATGMQGIAADRQCSMLTVEPNSGHLEFRDFSALLASMSYPRYRDQIICPDMRSQDLTTNSFKSIPPFRLV